MANSTRRRPVVQHPTSSDTGTRDAIAARMRSILTELGEDPAREGLQRTPERYARAMEFLTSGYQASVDQEIRRAIFSEKRSELVLVKDIELYSLCEHHLLPFFGKCHVAYIPRGKIVGLSKIPRLIEIYARRLQVQERLTTQIADEMVRLLRPAGVLVVVEAVHLCMMMRGVEKQNATTVTSAVRGVFKTNASTRQEVMSLLTRSVKIG